MLTFSCPGCGQKIQINQGLEGNKAKCPRCGQLVTVPAEPTSVGAGWGRPLSRPPDDQERPDLSAASTPSSVGGETLAFPADPSRKVYDFLAPPQQSDELGRLGSYRVLKVLGAGGMGVVFQAEDPQLGRLVALKVVNPTLAGEDVRQRFMREARATAALDHDHVVAIHQVGEDRDVPFLIMPLLQGESLDDRLKRESRLPVPEVLRIGREMAEGLAAAHEKGLIHRDIKPGNVWLEGKRGRVKLLELGLARAGGGEPHLTQSGMIVGTPAFMAPEQARSEEVDPRCDLFSLGAVLYRLCTGELPFQGKDAIGILLSLAMHRPQPPQALHADVPAALSDLVMRLLAKDRDQRPASAQAVAEELAAIAAVTGRTERLAPRSGAKGGRGRTLLLVAVGLLGLVPLVWWLTNVVLRVETANGTLVVEINDAETEARIKNGKLILTGPEDKIRYTLEPSERNKELAAGEYRVRVEGADGLTVDTPEFTLKKGDKVTVRVTAEPRVTAKRANPDREAAEWVLSIGGVVRVNGQEQDIRAAADLPREPFRLTGADLSGNERVTDEGLAHFKDCNGLTGIGLAGTRISDAGLAHFKGCKGLSTVYLAGTKVSDAGLATFKDCKNLISLGLGRTSVSDKGLAHFKDCQNLMDLWLGNTQVSEAGLAFLADRKSLTALRISSTKVSDLSPLKNLPLKILHCAGLPITDLSPLQGMPLKELQCDFKPERDAEILRSIKTLEIINGKPANEFWKEAEARKQ